ncbi:hypothetical protein CBW65_05955 [Tumebacillus avium]|uniref:Uncharacterized protein n=1 Tax=Tumebacillus avium TaxID=1903704 RepID=A0A1Y0IJM4_9BACL|nr:CBO0543 family protein [Tumebacillus avium]ARU60678.1 hypothetical protein CBW65_05955 [Tumebacillus avium]
MHYLEWSILAASWIVAIGLLVRFLPKSKLPDACVIFLVCQAVTWVGGLIAGEMELVQYPVRIMKSNRTSAEFEYLFLPVFCIVFTLYYPAQKSKIAQWLYYVLYTSAITVVEVILERYTLLIKYTGWKWYWTFLTVMATFYLTRKYYQWFGKKPNQAK